MLEDKVILVRNSKNRSGQEGLLARSALDGARWTCEVSLG